MVSKVVDLDEDVTSAIRHSTCTTRELHHHNPKATAVQPAVLLGFPSFLDGKEAKIVLSASRFGPGSGRGEAVHRRILQPAHR
jgi:hypothetical protein